MKGRVVIAGGSGFIGTALTRALLDSGREVVVLSRSGKAPKGARGAVWDGRSVGAWADELEDAEAVVNLAGTPINCKWTNLARVQISSSRVGSSLLVGRAAAMCKNPPRVWINASAVGVYGNSGGAELDETAVGANQEAVENAEDHGQFFLAQVCRTWEQAVDQADTPSTRKVKLRIGFVLARDGGALPVLVKLTKAFFGGAAGNGRQYVSWIHIDDLVRLTLWLIESEIEGPVNATAPNPVTNAELMAALRKQLGRPWSPPVPAPVLRLVGKTVGPDASLVLEGQRVVPKKALDGGFSFRFPELPQAFGDLFRR